MSNSGTVVPICSALGFAHVLQATECDQHLVRFLLRPLRRVRALLVPGGIAAGYIVNSTIVSQTGTAAVLGPILIPLLRASGLTPVTAGSILLLGSSVGGALFDPGAVGSRTLAELTGRSGPAVGGREAPLNLPASGTAMLAFWILTRYREKAARAEIADDDAPRTDSVVNLERVDLSKAMIPLLPLILLFADSGLGRFSPLRTLEGPPKILAAMLIGIAVAGLAAPRQVRQLATAFFDGAGYGYTHVISLIVAA